MPWTLPTVPLTSVPLTRTDDAAATPAVPVADEEVLRSGWLEKRLPVLRDTWEPHWCILTATSLRCYADPTVAQDPKHALQLRQLRKVAAFREDDAFGDALLHRATRPCGFVLDLGLEVPHPHQRFVHFDAMDEKLLEEWLSALNPILQEEIQVDATLGSESPQVSEGTPSSPKSPKPGHVHARKRTFLYRKHSYKVRKHRPRGQVTATDDWFDVAPARSEPWRRAWKCIMENGGGDDNLEELLDESWRPASYFSTESTAEVTAQVHAGLQPWQRRKAWFLLSGAAAKRAEGPSYAELMEAGKKLDHEEAVRVIQADLHRTGMEGVNESALENVLLAFAAKNSKIGYCQSMSFVAATMLMYMEEESAFWTLCSLLEDILPEDYFSERMVGLRTDLRVLQKLLAEEAPELAEHLDLEGIDLSPITVNWFLCLFLNTLPTEWSHRVLDSVLHEGSCVLFRMALSILWQRRSDLLHCTSLPDAFAYLRSPMASCHDECGMAEALDSSELWELMFASWLNDLSGRLRVLRQEQLRVIQAEDGEPRRKILPSFSWSEFEWTSVLSMSSWLSLSPKSDPGASPT